MSSWDPNDGVSDPGLERLEAALSPLRHRAPLRELPPRRRPRRTWAIAAGVLAAAAAVLLFLVLRPRPTPDGFKYEATAGTTRKGVLPVGGAIETRPGEVVRVEVADIGTIDLQEDSRLSLVRTGPTEHRLDLRRGKLHAQVNAPPRLFVIDTPAATAVDLGCEYDLEIADDGSGFLRVTNGIVELGNREQVVVVVMGAMARIRPGRGPGTPAMNSSSTELRLALDRLDEGDLTALDDVLRHATIKDTLTLWNLLVRRDLDRSRIFDRLAAVIPLPIWIERDRVIAGEQLDLCREELEPFWYWPETLDQR
jgi:ferric-dicitrate binding protein FerR (iron transport regulator)